MQYCAKFSFKKAGKNRIYSKNQSLLHYKQAYTHFDTCFPYVKKILYEGEES